jgi:hypothetical protein
MFNQILIADRDDGGREASGAAQPHCMVRAARAGDFTAETQHV